MIKILKVGAIPKERVRVYRMTCLTCGTIFEATKRDFRREIVGHGETDDVINCPMCGKSLSLLSQGMTCDWSYYLVEREKEVV